MATRGYESPDPVNTGRFRPPDEGPGERLELERPPNNGARGVEHGSEAEADIDLAVLRPRKPRRYRKPKHFPLILVGLALVGFFTVFAFVVRQVKDKAPAIVQAALDMDVKTLVEADPPTYEPPADIVEAVLIDLDVRPRTARIYLDGEAVQSNPMRIPRGDTERELIVWEGGYEPARVRFKPDAKKTLRVRLRRTAEN